MYTIYESHIRISFHGNIFVVPGIGDNDQMVCLEMYFYYDNDS